MVLHALMNTKISGKNALVTGAGGFIGGRLVELLIKKGYRVNPQSQYSIIKADWLAYSLYT